MKRPFDELLAERVVLFDGGTGTEIYSRGVFVNQCYELLNLERAELVAAVHRAFAAAGADVVETNTFSASRPRLEPHGLDARLAEINRAGARLARDAVGGRAYVAGSVGPLGIRLEPWGPTTVGEAERMFREQIQALREGGIDLVCIETISDLVELQAAVRAARAVDPSLPVVAMMTVDDEGRTPEGVPAEWIGRKLQATEADVIGLNCSVGPAAMLTALEEIAAVSSKPLAAMPNAGIPRTIEGRTHYLTSPEYMGRYVRRFVECGARIVGGCCGTTPDHIRAMREALGSSAPREAPARVALAAPTVAPRDAVPRARRSRLGARLDAGGFLVLVELRPPHGWEVEPQVERALALGAGGADAVVVPDDPRSLAKISPLALALRVAQAVAAAGERAGVEPILEYTCRDRSLSAMHSDLLGAHALGLRNLLLVTGREPRPGEAVWSSPVFDVDAIGLMNVVHRLNHGLDVGDGSIGRPTEFLAAVQTAPTARDRDEEVRRFEWKVDAGADLAITSPVFDVPRFERFLEAIAPVRIPIVAGVWLLDSARDASRLAEETPGVTVPRRIVERMEAAPSEEAARREGLEIAREVVAALGPHVEGIYLCGPGAADERALALAGEWSGKTIAGRRAYPGRPGILSGRS